MITKFSSVLGRCFPSVRHILSSRRHSRALPPEVTAWSLFTRRVHTLTGVQSRPDQLTATRRPYSVDKRKDRRVPRLVLVQSPFKWFKIKFDFLVLRSAWDPEFCEKEFQRGTRQAISKVSQLISAGEYAELSGLLTRPARLSLTRELDRSWSLKQRALLGLDVADIQISSARKVHFIRIAEKRFCDVDVAFLALKWVPVDRVDSLVFAEIFARFHRDYSPSAIPEWTIAYLKVVRFQILRRSADGSS